MEYTDSLGQTPVGQESTLIFKLATEEKVG